MPLHSEQNFTRLYMDYITFYSQFSVELCLLDFFLNFVENIINTLIKNSVREDLSAKDFNLIESTFSAVMNIIHNLRNPTIIEKYLKHSYLELKFI